MLFEYAGKVLGIVKPDGFGSLGNGMPILQQGLGTFHQKTADIGRCAVAGACFSGPGGTGAPIP